MPFKFLKHLKRHKMGKNLNVLKQNEKKARDQRGEIVIIIPRIYICIEMNYYRLKCFIISGNPVIID
ncbi:hypothetical protein Phum_PHUM424380 [Pediculus humanus corporis]|uniref:Uncharacterized protein n=1 Tax=Pediculus humanus subsp. corporis TaxID=121224 RepID=E0VSX5_PEDHC|nr:uncharacterized protein Phum_PHUM424380 [Pediculus humanus corporis]EEB16481.1 hypothetical protein Phum_PHUM424380 [Pediculus humanus corporis]